MTRAAIVLVLLIGLSFAARSFLVDSTTITGSGAALAFGFLLLSALQTGRIFHALHLPHLTGFLLCGAVFGPEVLGLITPAMIGDLTMVKKVAVGLIALTAGCELNFEKLRPKIKCISLVSFVGFIFAVICLFAVIFGVSGRLEFMRGMNTEQRVVVSLICSNVLAALSPAVVMGILSETRAEGPLSELCLSIVVLADLLIAITFTFSESGARAVFPQAGGAGHSVFGELAVHIVGSIVAGAAVGAIFAVYIRRVGLRVGLFVFAVCFVVAETGTVMHLDPLLVGLSAGLFLENVSPVGGHAVIRHTEVAAMPTFAVFFAVVGAEVHVHAFLAVAPFAVAAAAARAVGIYAGARVGAGLAGIPKHIARRVPFGMLPQAGIALGLAGLVRTSFPGWGEGASTLLLGTIVVNEMVGPVLFRMALERAGEIGMNTEARSSLEPAHAPEPDPAASRRLAAAQAADVRRKGR